MKGLEYFFSENRRENDLLKILSIDTDLTVEEHLALQKAFPIP